MRIFPRSTTVYNKKLAYNGINLISTANDGALITSMDGTELKRFNLNPMPAKMMPNGNIISVNKFRSSDFGVSDGISLYEVDLDGNVVWNFDKHKYTHDKGHSSKWMARAHSDFQREGNSLGYFYEGQKIIKNPKTLILAHDRIKDKSITDKYILDDVILEVSQDGEILWKFSFSEHFDELGFSEDAKNVIYRNPNLKTTSVPVGNVFDVTSISTLGENKWYDQGDRRFHPDNILFTARAANIIGIIDRNKNKIVYKLGPNFTDFEKVGPVIGSTFASLIPKGLKGEGNLLIFDNGGTCGYGASNLYSRNGVLCYVRNYSRILEINPITLNVEFYLDPRDFGFSLPINGYKFYSPFGGNLQRLPNNNTLITLATEGMAIEVTEDKEIVWEWVSPYRSTKDKRLVRSNLIYRVYRYPYSYMNLENYVENDIEEIDTPNFSLKGAGKYHGTKLIEVEGAKLTEDIDPLTQESELNSQINKTREIIRENLNTVKKVSSNNFKENIRDTSTFIALFGANRCLHCEPLMEMLTDLIDTEFKDIKAYYIDVDDNKALAENYKINSLPTTIFFKKGREVYRFLGEKPYDLIAEDLEKYILD